MVPSLTSLKPAHLKRYAEIARLLLRYGRSDLVRQSGLYQLVAEEQQRDLAAAPAEARELANDLERLGPTFIKLGQVLSSRADLLPFEYMEALSRLQDNVKPFPYEEVERIVEDELNVSIHKAFQEFNVRPAAAASLGQVHHAVLRSGQPVAVKIQRPGVREQVTEDLDALRRIAETLDAHTELGRKYEFTLLLDDLRRLLIRELNYREEASHLRILADGLCDFPSIVVPRPIDDYTTSRVLTMQYVRGYKVTSISPLVRLEIDGHHLLEELFRAYLHQIIVIGLFHADPHPGNIFLTSDHRLALLDLGMVGRVPANRQDQVLRLLLSISQGLGEETAEILLEMSEKRENNNVEGFMQGIEDLISDVAGGALGDMNIGRSMVQLQRVAADNGVRLPREVRMIGKALLNLERVGAVLCADFDLRAEIRDHTAGVMRHKLLEAVAPGNLLKSFADIKRFVLKLPAELNQILSVVTRNGLRVRVDAIDEDRLMAGFQKVANRITVGLVVAAMIIGAALLMPIQTGFVLFGYPGLAILLFLFAALIGIYMVISILWKDIKEPRRPRRR
ncbi:MAG TPA: AarF/UbiB family protein [Candidatus Sumerlaeota bacterium]|nr:MAG: putative protein kinase UbiB [candidate division BRC1 bacterium ADurb.BinA292]HOE96146.1 AarF/UbiB family protein [Candidatus Sumerlaeota bacterium]HOR28761.1 AarF/UbiB family protein [Candidatus Sumerlaeota bacterium]HPK01670.1 AarF/UbiB family protein [Candidatus Sumerlaeota bacterium]